MSKVPSRGSVTSVKSQFGPHLIVHSNGNSAPVTRDTVHNKCDAHPTVSQKRRAGRRITQPL